eukprot:428046-Prorocentrum_minimum.AAC.2
MASRSRFTCTCHSRRASAVVWVSGDGGGEGHQWCAEEGNNESREKDGEVGLRRTGKPLHMTKEGSLVQINSVLVSQTLNRSWTYGVKIGVVAVLPIDFRGAHA